VVIGEHEIRLLDESVRESTLVVDDRRIALVSGLAYMPDKQQGLGAMVLENQDAEARAVGMCLGVDAWGGRPTWVAFNGGLLDVPDRASGCSQPGAVVAESKARSSVSPSSGISPLRLLAKRRWLHRRRLPLRSPTLSRSETIDW
jgi:hypothetical protein